MFNIQVLVYNFFQVTVMKVSKRLRLFKGWKHIEIETFANILLFLDYVVEVESKNDMIKLFGKKNQTAFQVYTRVSFKNATVPFWSKSNSIMFIHTSAWWMENFNNLQRVSITLKNEDKVNNYTTPNITEVESLLEKIESSAVKELTFGLTNDSFEMLETSISKLHTLESLTLRTIDRKNRFESAMISNQLSELSNLKYLSLEGFIVDFTFVGHLHSITALDVGLQHQSFFCKSIAQGGMPLKTLTLRQLYKKTCFALVAVPAIKYLSSLSTLNAVHIQYRALHDVKALLDVIPSSVKVLSIEGVRVYKNAQFFPLKTCNLDLDTLYLSGYLFGSHLSVISAVKHFTSLRTLSLGTAKVNHKCAVALGRLPSLKTVKITEGSIEYDGIAYLKSIIMVIPGPLSEYEARVQAIMKL
jgi:hypothetical protein